MKKEKKDKSIQKLEKEQKEVEILDENIEKMLEEEINKKALKIGRKVLDEIYLHGEDRIEVNIRKSSLFDMYVVEVDVHSITTLFDNEIEFIKKEGLREKSLNISLKVLSKIRI